MDKFFGQYFLEAYKGVEYEHFTEQQVFSGGLPGNFYQRGNIRTGVDRIIVYGPVEL
jgi:hypothetical protein